jgi:aromatic-L-amino-acid decarboxylase
MKRRTPRPAATPAPADRLPPLALIDPVRAGRFVHVLIETTLAHLRVDGRKRVYSGAGIRELERLFSGPLPERGVPVARLLAEFRRRILRHSLQTSHPRIFGLLHPIPLPVAAAAETAAALLNQSGDAWKAGPAAMHVEARLIRWINDRIGWGPAAFGVFTSGGGVANILALKMARDRAIGPGARRSGVPRRLAGRLRVYASAQSHFSIPRAVDLIGLGTGGLVLVPVDRDMKMRPELLDHAVRRDRRRGLVPVAVVTTAGTTSTGNIDPIPAINAIARRHGMHHHVDAAYGGAAIVSDRHRALLRGLAGADSVTIDPHKWMFQPISLGGLFVRDGRALAAAFRTEPDYLRKDLEREAGRLDFYHYSLEGSRPFRGLKLWLTIQAIGTAGLAALVDRTIDLTLHLVRSVERRPAIERFPSAVETTTCCVRYLPRWARGLSPRARRMPGVRRRLDALQLHIQHTLETRGDTWFPPTVLSGAIWLRLGVFNYLTTPDDMEIVLDLIEKVGASGD